MRLSTKQLLDSLTTRLQHRGLFKILLTLWLTLLLTFSPILPSLDPLILIGSNTSRASVITWDGEAGDARWSNPLNWDADRLPHPDEVARFAPEALIQPADQLTSESGETSDDDTTTDDSDIVSNVSIDVDVVVSGVEIADDFVGTIGTEAISLTVGSHGFRQAGGRFIARTSSFDLNGSLTVTDGIFVAPDTQLTISGHLNLTTPHFSHNAGTITLDGFNQLLFGAATFYNLEKTTQLAQTLELQSNSTFVIDNTLKLKGTIREPLTLTTTKSDPAFLEPKHAADLSYLHVNNIINLSPNHVACTTCTKDHATSGWGIETEADSTTIADRIAELFSNPEQLIPTPSLTDEPTLADTDRTPTIAGTTIQNLTLTDKQTADFEADEDITFTLTLTDNDTQLTLQPATLTTDTGLPADIGAEELPTTAEELQDAEQEQQDTETAETVPAEELDVVAETPEDATTSSDTDVLTDVAPADEESSESDSTEPLDSAQGKPTTTTEATEESGENPPEISSDTDDLSLLHYLIRPADASTSWGPGDVPVEAPDGQSSTDDLPLTGSSITAQILDPIGHETDIEPTITQIDGDTIIHVDAPTTTFRPGTYTLRVEATINGQTVTQRQDFTWGVLALNTSQSTYQPGDTVDIGMAVLDDEGHTLCNADLILTLTDPAGATETLTTEPYVEPTETDEQGNPIIPDQPDAAITRSSACGPRTVTNTPDYQTTIPDTIEGTYTLHLTATTENGTRILERDVLVTDTEPFTVTRTTATRIWPGADYQVQLTIEANQPFLGTITESVPSVFEITELSSNGEIDSPETTIADPTEDPEQPTELETLEDLLNGAPINASDSPTQLIWTNQAITPDNPLTLTYTYNPPDISPQFYLAGPVQLQATDTASGVGGPEEEIEPITADELPAEETEAETPETSPTPFDTTQGQPSVEPSSSPPPTVTGTPSPEVLGDTAAPTPDGEVPDSGETPSPTPTVTPEVSPPPAIAGETDEVAVSPSPTVSPTVTPTVTPEPTVSPEPTVTPIPLEAPDGQSSTDDLPLTGPAPEADVAGIAELASQLTQWEEPRQWQIASDATQTISGNCYQNDQTTACTDNGTVTVVKNGGTAVCTDTSYTSSYSCSGDISSGDVLTVYIDGAGDSNEAVSVTKWDGSGDVTGFDLIENHLSIGSDDDQTVTNEDLGNYDNSVSSDEDIFHDVANLVAHWKFDDGSGSTATEEIGSLDGSITGASWDNDSADLAPLNFTNSYSLSFDGDDDNVAVSDDNVLDLTNNFTVSFWIKTANGGGSDSFPVPIEKEPVNTAWLFGIDSTDEPYFRCDDGSLESAFDDDTINDGTWEHWAGTVDNRNLIFYRDGRAVDFEEMQGDCHTSTGDLDFGNGDGGNGFQGHLDDIRIYDQALNHSDIAALAAGDTGKTLTVDSEDARDEELYVKSGNTFDPLGNVYTHDVEIDGTWAESASIVEVTGSWDNDATFTKDSGTVIFASNSDETIDSTGATTDDFNNVIFNDSLIGYWKFDDNTGFTATDSSGYGRDAGLQDEGVVSGPTWDASVKASLNYINTSALEFDGTDEYVHVGPIDKTVKTVSMWINMDDATTKYLANHTDNGGAYIQLSSGDELTTAGWTSPTRYVDGATSPLTVSDNTWTHIAVTSATAIDMDLFLIGFREGAGSGNLDGHADDVRLWSRELSASDISDLANGDYLATEDTASSEYSLSSDLDVDGDLTLWSGDLSAGSNDITLAADWQGGDGIFTDGTGTVTLDGVDTTQNVNGTTEFYNLSVSDATNNTTHHTVKFEEGVTFTIANDLTLDGLDSNDQVLLESSDGSTQFTFHITGHAQCVDQVDVSDSNVTGTADYDINANSSDNTSNNDTTVDPSWVFGNCLIVKGTVYTDEGSTSIGSGKTVELAINGTDDTDAETDSNGAFTIITNTSVSATDILTLYIQQETEDGVTVTESDGTNIEGVDIYQDYLITRHDNSGSLTNADLDVADGGSPDADLTNIYTVDASDNVTVKDGKELLVWTGDTYAPGAHIIADDVDINGTLTLASNDAEVHGSWDATSGTFTSSGQVMFTSTADETITSNSNSFNDLYINDGLRGYWKLDDGTGTTAADSSGYGNDGTLTNGPTWANNAGDTAPTSFTNPYSVAFDGTNDYVEISDAVIDGLEAVTISAWINIDSLQGGGNADGIVTHWKAGDLLVLLRSIDGAYQGFLNTGGSVGGAFNLTLSTGAWQHVALTYDGSTIRGYLDAVEGSTTYNDSGAISTPSTDLLRIGGEGSAASEGLFDGHIDDVRIYSRALSADEISALAAGNQPATEDTAASEFSLSGTLDVNGDLILNSGELDADAAITVAGAWHNNGGKFNESTQTVTLDDASGTNEVQSGGQAFYNLTSAPTGSTTYELHDDLTVNNVLSLADSDSTFDGKTYSLFVDDFEQSNGDFTGSNSTVVLTTSDDETVSFGTGDDAYHNVHTEDSQENGLVGYWKFDEGQGTTAVDSSGNSNDGTLTNDPFWKNHAYHGLVGYWKMDENTGTAVYDETGRSEGTLAGDATWDAVAADKPVLDYTNTSSVTFDGTGDSIDLSNESNFDFDKTDPFSFSAWIKTSTDANQCIFCKYNTNASTPGFGFEQRVTTKNILIGLYDSSGVNTLRVEGSTEVDDGVWHHVAGTYDGSVAAAGISIWVDGNDETENTVEADDPGSILNSLTPAIGERGVATARSFMTGNIDEVQVYNRVLQENEIASLALGKPLDESTITDFQNLSYLDFDGTNDYVDLVSHLSDYSSNAVGTVSAWFKRDTTSNRDIIFTLGESGSDDRFIIELDAGATPGEARILIREASSNTVDVSGGDIDDTDWHHVVAINDDANEVKLYLDGVDITPGSPTANANNWFDTITSSDDLQIGADLRSSSQYMDGAIDDVRIYDYALSTDEITNLYNGSYASNTPDEDLVGYWKLDETTTDSCSGGEDACDSSTNNNHGTYNSSPTQDTSTKATLDFTNGAALEFDGTDDYVDVGDVDVTGGITLSLWVNPDNSPASRTWEAYIVKRDDTETNDANYGFDKVNLSDEVRFYFNVSGTWHIWQTTDFNVTSGAWQHLAVTFDESNHPVFYRNAVSASHDSGGTPQALPTNDAETEIASYDGGTTPFDGHLDDVRIYNRTLSVGEIEQLHGGGTNDAVITLDTTLDVNNDLHLHSGALDANASENNNQTIAGDLNNNDLFIPRTSTTTLDGTDQRFTGSTTVYNLTKEETSDDASDATLTFESSKLFTILNTLTFRGIDTDDRLNIDATTSGTKATLNPTSADQDTQWLDLTDTESSTYDILARRSNDTSNTDSSEASPHWIIRTRNAIQRLIGDE